MAQTSKNNIYYNDNYDDKADVLADMKKLAESVDTAVENAKYNDSNITARVSTLETDNTTNKADISNIKTKNNEQDTNIEELQENLSDAQQEINALKTIQNALPTIDGEGENLTLKGTAENTTFKKFEICGNSSQESREGYNKLQNTLVSSTENGITSTANSDGSVTLNGTATKNTSVEISNKQITLEDETYTYYLKGKTTGFNFFITKSDDETYEILSSADTSIKKSVNLGAITIKNVKVYVMSGTTLNNLTVYPMIYEGTEEKEYEAYGAMPSPGFSSEIESVGDDVNQFNKDEIVLKDGYYTMDNIFTDSSTTCYTENFIKVIPNTDYILSGFKRHSSSYNYPSIYAIYFYDNEKNWISRTSVFYASNSAAINEYLEYQFKTPSDCRYIRFQCQTTEIDLDLDTIELKLEEYIGTASVEICNKNTIDLLSEDLTSGGWHTGSTYNENNVKVLKSPYNSGKNWNSFYFLNEKIVGKNVSISFDIKVNNLEYISLLSLQNTDSYGNGTIEGIKKFITKNDTYVHVKINNYLVTTNMLAFFVQSSYVEGTENDSIYIYIKNFQIEENPVATDYIEHQEQNFTMPTQKEMLEGDYFDLDTLEEVHVWDKTVFDGTEEFNSAVQDNMIQFSFNKNLANKDLLSNFFKNTTTWWVKDTIIAGSSLNSIYIQCSKDDFPDVPSFKTWLAQKYQEGKPLEIYSKPATEERLAMTDEQKEIAKQIKNTLISYKDTTHIYSEDSISPLFKCSAIADMTAMLNNIQAQILAEEV